MAMDTKILAAVAVCAAVIIVVAVAVAVTWGDDDENAGFIGVVYDGNGGSTLDGDPTFRMTSGTVMENAFTYEGRVFTGWNSATDGSGTSYSPGDEIAYPEGGYVMVYAQWAYALSVGSYSDLGTGDLYEPTFYIMDSGGNLSIMDMLNANALPSGGFAGITFSSPQGTVWTYDRVINAFVGQNGNATFYVSIELMGDITGQVEAEVTDGGIPLYTFLFDGPVSAYITVRNVVAA